MATASTLESPVTAVLPAPVAPADAVTDSVTDTVTDTAARFRRRAAGYAALLSGALVFVSMLMIPFDSVGSREYLQSNADHPAQIRWAAVVLHYGFLLLIPAILGMTHLARYGARRLANTGLVLGILGSGLSGIIAVDYYDLALAQNLPMDQAVKVYEAAGDTAGAAPALIAVPSVFGILLGCVLSTVALRRAGFTSWLPVGVMAAGWVVFFLGANHWVVGATGTGLIAAATALVGTRILRATDEEWRTGVPA
jgi:hypothetical protein